LQALVTVILIGVFMMHTASTQEVVWWRRIFINSGFTHGHTFY